MSNYEPRQGLKDINDMCFIVKISLLIYNVYMLVGSILEIDKK